MISIISISYSSISKKLQEARSKTTDYIHRLFNGKKPHKSWYVERVVQIRIETFLDSEVQALRELEKKTLTQPD